MRFFETQHRFELVDTETGKVIETGHGGVRAAQRIARLEREYVDGYRAHTSNIMPGAPYQVLVDGAPLPPYETLDGLLDEERQAREGWY